MTLRTAQPEIRTARLELVPATADTHRMELSRHIALSRALHRAIVPANWPPDEVRDVLEWFAQGLESEPDNYTWNAYYWIAQDSTAGRILVGSGGFKGRPDANGAVEIGYSVLPQFRRQGYATEAVRGLVDWARSCPDVRRVLAEALPENTASVGVLTKCGFGDIGPGSEPGLRRFQHGFQHQTEEK